MSEPGVSPADPPTAEASTAGGVPLAAPAPPPAVPVEPHLIPASDAPKEMPSLIMAPEPPAAPVATFAPAPPTAVVAPAPATATFSNGPPSVDPLDERLRRLETVLAKLADTRATPTPAAQQITARPTMAMAPPPVAPAAPPPAAAPNVMLDQTRSWLPTLAAAVARVQPPPTAGPSALPPARSAWLLFDIATELRTIQNMYGDPRYRLTWSGRLLPATLLVLMFTTWLWLPGSSIPTIGWLIVKVADVVLAFLLFKVLNREGQRYRDMVPQFAQPYPPPYS